MKLRATFAIVIGLLMLGQWAFFIATDQVPELETEPVRIGFHLAAEGTTALCLVGAGVGLLLCRAWAREAFLVGAGMLLYTSIVSPGYFAQQGDWVFLLMFGVIISLTLASLRGMASE